MNKQMGGEERRGEMGKERKGGKRAVGRRGK